MPTLRTLLPPLLPFGFGLFLPVSRSINSRAFFFLPSTPTDMASHRKLIHFLRPDPAIMSSSSLSSPRSNDSSSISDDDTSSTSSSFPPSSPSSPSRSSPPKSPWTTTTHLPCLSSTSTTTGLVASLSKEAGKIYSLATTGDLLYTGTDSETVRVWRDRRDLLAGFRTGSGLIKAIVVSHDGRVFTGHQDGKIRVWRRGDADDVHRRVGTLPSLGDLLVSSVNPSSYVAVQKAPRRGRRRAVWLRHTDAVSCLSLDEDAGLLYSGSWDRTFKAWRLADSRCVESVHAHDDAVNTVAVAGFDGLVLTGSADGTVKVWRREVMAGSSDRTSTRHVMERVVQEGDAAVTAIAACAEARAVYVGTSDGVVTCWRWGLDGGEPRRAGVLAGHRMAVMCLAVSGRVVVSGSADRTLCVWRRDGEDELGRFEHVRLAVLAGHTGPVKCVAVAAEQEEDGCDGDGERRFVVYSGSLDGSVKVWRLSEERPLEMPAVMEARVPLVPLMESEVWTTPRRTTLMSPPGKAWVSSYQAPPEMKRVAAA